MGIFGFIKGLVFKKKIEELPPLTGLKEPEKPDFTEKPLSFGIREESSDKLELIKTKIDLINSRLENIDRRLAEIERLAEER